MTCLLKSIASQTIAVVAKVLVMMNLAVMWMMMMLMILEAMSTRRSVCVLFLSGRFSVQKKKKKKKKKKKNRKSNLWFPLPLPQKNVFIHPSIFFFVYFPCAHPLYPKYVKKKFFFFGLFLCLLKKKKIHFLSSSKFSIECRTRRCLCRVKIKKKNLFSFPAILQGLFRLPLPL